MRRIAVVVNIGIAFIALTVLGLYWGLLLKYGHNGRVRFGPIAYTAELLIFASIVGLPALVFCACRAAQLVFPGRDFFSGWVSLRGISNVFASIGLALLMFVLIFDTPWKGIVSTDWREVIRAVGKPQELILTDASLEFPALPLQRQDNYSWSVYDLDGHEVPLAQFKGKKLFLNLWATWCGPCRAEMPAIQHLMTQSEAAGVTFMLISNEEANVVREFVMENKCTLPVYVVKGRLPRQFESGGIPATFILTGDGNIAYSHIGAAAWDTGKTREFLAKL